MDRRDFIKLSSIGLAGLSLPKLWAAAPKKDSMSDKYSIVILGDTHYDAADPEYYHAGYYDPDPKREAAHRKEFVRNGEMWAGRCRKLVKRAACLVDEDTRFVYQVGDLIQGDIADTIDDPSVLDGYVMAGSYIRPFTVDLSYTYSF